jgi:hypothetical protein
MDQEEEIIGQEETESSHHERIKIKIKEQVHRHEIRPLSLPVKIILLLFACLFGFVVGSKLINSYISYWSSPKVEFHPEEKDSNITELKAGEVFSVSPK